MNSQKVTVVLPKAMFNQLTLIVMALCALDKPYQLNTLNLVLFDVPSLPMVNWLFNISTKAVAYLLIT